MERRWDGGACWLVDLTGSTAAPIWFAGLLCGMVVPLVLWFRWLERPIISATIHSAKG